MNPFMLQRPEFLLFFAAISIAAIFLQRYLCEKRMPDQSTSIAPTDPYALAYLARGPIHAINAAVLSLIERKLLKVQGAKITLGQPDAKGFVHDPLEKKIIEYFGRRRCNASKLTSVKSVRKVAKKYHSELVKNDLLISAQQIKYRFELTLLLTIGVVMVAVIEILFSCGIYNVVLLILLTIVVFYILNFRGKSRLTPAGKRVLKEQKALCHERSKSNIIDKTGESPEMVRMFALLGFSILPAEAYGWQTAIYPAEPFNETARSSCSSCSSSSCSSSSCSSSSCSSSSCSSSSCSSSSCSSGSDSGNSSDSCSSSSCGSSCGGGSD